MQYIAGTKAPNLSKELASIKSEGQALTAEQVGRAFEAKLAELAGLPETEDTRVLEFFASNEAVSEARDLYADIKINAAARTSL